jgi:hypothetical protein
MGMLVDIDKQLYEVDHEFVLLVLHRDLISRILLNEQDDDVYVRQGSPKSEMRIKIF